jgi:hypothetical protein
MSYADYHAGPPDEEEIPRSKRGSDARRKQLAAMRKKRDGIVLTTRCAGCRRVIHEGPLGAGRRAYAAHRATCPAVAA